MLTYVGRPWKSQATQRENNDNFLKRILRDGETDSDGEIAGRVEEIAEKKGVSMASVATAWSLSKGVSPIIGLSSKKRIDEACENIKVKLTEEEIKYLEEPYTPKPTTGY